MADGFVAGGTDHEVNVDFTKINKSGYNYFSINRNLNNSERYRLDINNPDVVLNDSQIFYQSNPSDNQANNGLVIYGKNVEKNYPSNSYFNTIRYGDSGVLDRYKSLIYTGAYGNNQEKSSPVKQGFSMKYNTANHAVFSFKEVGGITKCMPRLKNSNENPSSVGDYESFSNPSWYRSTSNGFIVDLINRDVLNTPIAADNNSTVNSLPIFDIYSNVDESTKYGGVSQTALFNNQWIPCGDAVRISSSPLIINFTEGDTYISRFDMLRVFPNDLNQIPQHTEIVSFICESFINTDGRSDVNRYNTDSSIMTPGNYGLMNDVYSQQDNYFTYNILDPDLFNTSSFKNTILWSKSKLAGESVDT